ncbi:hypothetical protein JHK82_044351 [Glycine max]|nr:hypothetical protein JHK86_044699 [Glycine max]KAG4940672.1 hypothetical protein JHK87_044543 [Glycine soja]KAG4951443.1 hypothetical protein JHK85_045310 [Glycine max]KAG5099299.1 hypothetical protein JHK82_044351 [Glycine max]KAG5107903.1 hypothetical protein JHK84_044810 [Glycine max]
MDQFKSFGYEDLAITGKSLLDYGCLESILIPPSDRFEGFNPSINEAINLIQAEMMDYIAIKITTCPSNFTAQNYPCHVMKLLPEDHRDYPYLFNDEYESWDVQGNTQYQYSLLFLKNYESPFWLGWCLEENKIYIRPKSKCGQFAIFSTQLNIQKTDKDKRKKSYGFIIFHIFPNKITYSVHLRIALYPSNLIFSFHILLTLNCY